MAIWLCKVIQKALGHSCFLTHRVNLHVTGYIFTINASVTLQLEPK